MSNSLTLLSSPGSHHSRRVALLLSEMGVEVPNRIIDVRPPGMGGENERPEFLAINPNGKVPVLQDGDFVLTESNAIMGYLADTLGPTDLWPAEPVPRATVAQWQFWQAAHLTPTADGFLIENLGKPMMGESPDPAVIERLTAEFARWAGVMEHVLNRSQYLALDRLTCADLSVAAALMYAGPAQIPVESHPVVAGWLARIQARDSWSATAPPPMPRP